MDQATVESISSQLEQRIASKSLVLPMLPQVISQVLTLVNDVDSDAAALALLIQSDQALAGHVMRIANSAAYSPHAKLTSLQQAIARLGMQNMTEIAMAATMGPKLFSVRGFESMVKDIWESSLATAVWARELARQGRRNVESTFLCGLLFQIGKPVVLEAVLDITKTDSAQVDPDWVALLVNQYQQQVGALLADHWQLPVAVVHTINSVDSDGPAEGSQDIVDTVKAARVFSAITQGDRNYDADSLSADPTVVEINMYADDVQQLLAKADRIHDTIGALSL
ncbi:MAG: HDOD domain-containing protein [Pseudomonadales bacterium]